MISKKAVILDTNFKKWYHEKIIISSFYYFKY